jgi:hypothetical protein
MKNPMRMTAAAALVLEALKKVLQGQPLPVYTDPDFEEFALAVSRVTQGDDFRWLGKGLILPVAEHVMRNVAAQRQAAQPKE